MANNIFQKLVSSVGSATPTADPESEESTTDET